MVAATAKKSAPAKSSAPKQAPAPRQSDKGKSSNLDKQLLLKMYEDMLLIRRFEEKAGQLYGQGAIGGFCHLYIGQEAVVVGMQSTITGDDAVITTYRDHGHMLACGMEPKGVMAELTGRQGGYSKGKGGSMHMFSAEKNFYGGHGIVGASVPIGAGLAFARKYNGLNTVSLTYYGDGAANQGQVYEAFNMAALWKLPTIFIIENNQYAMGTSVKRGASTPDFYKRGEAFGIPSMKVDGMDVIKVREAGETAVAHCRAGKGPYVLQMETYRYRGHSMSDPAKYRTREEVDKMRAERDPIEHLQQQIVAANFADEEALKKIDQRVKKRIVDAADFALSDPEPDPAELYTDVLA